MKTDCLLAASLVLGPGPSRAGGAAAADGEPVHRHGGTPARLRRGGPAPAARRVSEAEFIRMSRPARHRDPGRAQPEKYDELHVKGAINLSFPDISFESLQPGIPGQEDAHPDLLQRQLPRGSPPPSR